MSSLEIAVLNEGERYLPKFQAYNAAMHLGHMASYREALRYSYGRRVLDIGCGVGYGAFFLACYGATSVVAVDLGGVALSYAKATYYHPKLTYAQSDALRLPFADGSFDFVFSSQVIEHVPNVEDFLLEIRRVMAPSGLCLIITPNQALFSPTGLSTNPHHISEMSWVIFRQHLQNIFPQAHFRGIPQRCLQILSGSSTPVTKPNREIRITDYVPQLDDPAECENMLGYGQMQRADFPSSLLPNTLEKLANTLHPIFWDASVKQWVLLGLLGAEEATGLLEQRIGQKLIINFTSPLPFLYRIELDLAANLRYPLSAMILCEVSSTPIKIAIRLATQSPYRTIELLFDPLPNSHNAQFRIEIDIDKRLYWPPWPIPSVKWATSPSNAKSFLGTKAVVPAVVVRTLHQGLPLINP